jgi:hypothetical protein
MGRTARGRYDEPLTAPLGRSKLATAVETAL